MAKILFPPRKTSFLLLLLLLIYPPLSTSTNSTNDDDNSVYDDYGKPVKVGEKYSIFIPGSGSSFGSVSMVSKQAKCPQFVAISRDPKDFGPGIEFYPTDSSQKTVQLSADLSIVFSAPGDCPGRPVWQLTRAQDSADSGDVTADGDQKNKRSWFRIENADNSFGNMPYKIRYCPEKKGHSSNVNDFDCGDLGLKSDEKDRIWVNFGVDMSVPFNVRFLPKGDMPPTPPPAE